MIGERQGAEGEKREKEKLREKAETEREKMCDGVKRKKENENSERKEQSLVSSFAV